MKWVEKTFDQLTTNELYTLLEHRTDVFVVEQNCPYKEVDGRDDECVHIWLEDDGEMLAYCRILPPQTSDEYDAIGRVLVTKKARGKGYARDIMNKAIDKLKQRRDVEKISLHGQEHLRYFYASFGFEEISEVYLEDDIPHVDMLMKL
ncbi:GNAT family N-acetyltransferase [Halobacillus shinanisalinarum]|uniref:GNAT family N-acetyltransferase n=1 Tax=Halobacillus shinanisalinarum TaxID=2932258 RepID=A0ABY4GUS1_9BACI|nr:GNAT family N-acetyltransferase [Halobacillus shinanisalinarum]UOQ91739.1 GNAT family N-acetyltransferase [Halobacillus shinanisalinarum]